MKRRFFLFGALVAAGTIFFNSTIHKNNKTKGNGKNLVIRDLYLAGGCFWGMQGYFDKIDGIVNTTVGYANGYTDITSYEKLKETGHAETIKLSYDSNIISLKNILQHYFRIIDPTLLNKQGNDVGIQYRTGIYYVDENEKKYILNFIKNEQKKYDKSIVVEVQKLDNFIIAEEYHQKYLQKNPFGYCHIDLNLAYEPLNLNDKFFGDIVLDEQKNLKYISQEELQELLKGVGNKVLLEDLEFKSEIKKIELDNEVIEVSEEKTDINLEKEISEIKEEVTLEKEALEVKSELNLDNEELEEKVETNLENVVSEVKSELNLDNEELEEKAEINLENVVSEVKSELNLDNEELEEKVEINLEKEVSEVKSRVNLDNEELEEKAESNLEKEVSEAKAELNLESGLSEIKEEVISENEEKIKQISKLILEKVNGEKIDEEEVNLKVPENNYVENDESVSENKESNNIKKEFDSSNFVKLTKEELKNKLNELEYKVTQENYTEKPFSSELNNEYRKGIYVDVVTGEPLFSSLDKFDSGCGWPSFSKPIEKGKIDYLRDTTHAMVRTEIRSKLGNSHLGHVFDDGPDETGGLRYCVNGAALRFICFDDMEKEGYIKYKQYVE